MDLHQIGIELEGIAGPLDGRAITPNGLNGIFLDMIRQYDPAASAWLHDHDDPKPYSIAPAHYDSQQRKMAGMLVSTLSDEATDIITAASREAFEEGTVLRFGEEDSKVEQLCCVGDLIPVETTTFERLANLPARRKIKLQFLTPAAFSRRQGELLFPLPANVFRRPFELWQVFAPDEPQNYQLPPDWLDWCDQNIFCTQHAIQTKRANLNYRRRFRGFVGEATFEARLHKEEQREPDLYLSAFNALARFANFTGIGRKTAMGMGAVDVSK